MLKPSRQKQRERREFVVSDVGECSHPDSLRTYLGNQGANAYYQCQQCGAVLINTAREGLPKDEENGSLRSSEE